jgi:hypothetical protein
MKYNEDKIIKEISDYISNTYTEHYSTTKDGFQVQDMLRHLGIDKDFCQANAIKYLARYGKKNGKNRKDLLKAIHYVVLLMSSEDNDMLDDAEENEIDDIENDYIENEIKDEGHLTKEMENEIDNHIKKIKEDTNE